ncbi:MAG: transporter substrate-binding domain-containing protein [Desulfobacula sp.]|nr:transporter substrate-binding domain-containing protein [Desulfobacula sp.]
MISQILPGNVNTKFLQYLYKSFLVVLFVLIISSFACGKEIFTINTADKPPYSTEFNTGIYDQIIQGMFKNIGVKIQINHLTSARSIENVSVGFDDGEYARIAGLSNQYENLRIVNEKLIDFAFTAFSKDSSIRIENWGSLKDYHVAFIRGWKIYEKNVKVSKSKIFVASEKELFQLVEKNRVDIVLYELLRGFDFMKKQKIKGIVNLNNPLSVRSMFLYVNKKHGGLVPQLENELRTMKTNGEYNKIINSFLK